ncbi:MAG: T9SS type A sorting domain-containing protein [Melioribacteraceae bacterium]|nr:T9SS type A sorting domain-containing protein [Melioribacteraceae bacterium]
MKYIFLFLLIISTMSVAQYEKSSDYNLAGYNKYIIEVYPDSAKGFLLTWSENRYDAVIKAAQRYNQFGEAIGSNFVIRNYSSILYSADEESFGIFDTTFSVTYEDGFTRYGSDFIGSFFNEDSARGKFTLGGNFYPECGTGYVGTGNAFVKEGESIISVTDFGGQIWVRKISVDGSNKLVDINENVEEHPSNPFISVNTKGEYLIPYLNIFYGETGLYFKSYSGTDTLITKAFIDSLQHLDQYFMNDENHWLRSFTISDSLFQILLVDSLKLNSYKVDINGNLLDKKSFEINSGKMGIEDFYFGNSSFSYSNFSNGKRAVLYSLMDQGEQLNSLYYFDDNGDIIGEPIFDSMLKYQLKDQIFKDENDNLYFGAEIDQKVYLMKYKDFSQIESVITGILESKTIQQNFHLKQNYPNPFNPSTTIEYSIPSVGIPNGELVQINVFDVLGNKIKTLYNGTAKSGNHKIKFDGKNLPSGTYFVNMRYGNFKKTIKVLLLK